MPMIRRANASGRGFAPGPAGFTLIELMVTMAVVGILAVVAVPAMTGLIRANRLASASGDLTASLQLARSEAIRRGATVRVCATADATSDTCANTGTWTNWIVIGRDNVASETAGSEVIDMIRRDSTPGDVQLSGPADGIRFRPSGLTDGEETLTVCMPITNPPQNRRVVTVMVSGTVRTDPVNGGGSCT